MHVLKNFISKHMHHVNMFNYTLVILYIILLKISIFIDVGQSKNKNSFHQQAFFKLLFQNGLSTTSPPSLTHIQTTMSLSIITLFIIFMSVSMSITFKLISSQYKTTFAQKLTLIIYNASIYISSNTHKQK